MASVLRWIEILTDFLTRSFHFMLGILASIAFVCTLTFPLTL